ncbi:zona pellucida-binding protein 2 [Grus japonensis]|uniref:Zona pellucida-binding protein 2 n=1 Tax=Grus japonensis TaxID=30415 RepID=A0ABC9XMY9_GRUJA
MAAAVVVVVVAAAGLGALTGVRAVPKEEQHSVNLIEKNYVYGDTKHEVNVYVKVFTNSPFLVCMDLARSQEEVIDPKYLWIGPDGKNLEGRMYVNLTETGKLMVMGFKEFMSGAYTCTLSHKIIETTTQEEREMFEAYKFMVYVNPFAPGWEEVCHQVPYDCEDATNMKVQEARDRIGEFFNKQTYALKHEFETVPVIHYVDNSFSVTHIDSCRPGFGKNDITHKNCASCCGKYEIH